jgi:hypothetical protein
MVVGTAVNESLPRHASSPNTNANDADRRNGMGLLVEVISVQRRARLRPEQAAAPSMSEVV